MLVLFCLLYVSLLLLLFRHLHAYVCLIMPAHVIRRHHTCDFREHATSAPAELGGEIHDVLRNRALIKVLLQAHKLDVYGSGTFGAFWYSWGETRNTVWRVLFRHPSIQRVEHHLPSTRSAIRGMGSLIRRTSQPSPRLPYMINSVLALGLDRLNVRI